MKILDLMGYIGPFIGFVTGVIASLFTWFITTFCLRSHIEISPEISKLLDEGQFVYRIKILNRLKRDAYNISIYFRVHLLIYPIIAIELAEGNIIPRLPGKSKENNEWEREVSIDVLKNAKALKDKRIKNDDILEKGENGTITLEDVFDLNNNAYAEVILVAYDAFGQTQKLFQQQYTQKDIHPFKFKSGSVELDKSQPTQVESV
jgi:hypothetical protein